MDATIPFVVCERPAGGFAVQRFANGRIERYGLRASRREAEVLARFANRPKPEPKPAPAPDAHEGQRVQGSRGSGWSSRLMRRHNRYGVR